jgi:hypothetical protein
MFHLSKRAVLKKNTNNNNKNKNKIQMLWILEFYALPAKFVKFVSPDSRVVRISGIRIFGLLLYISH